MGGGEEWEVETATEAYRQAGRQRDGRWCDKHDVGRTWEDAPEGNRATLL